MDGLICLNCGSMEYTVLKTTRSEFKSFTDWAEEETTTVDVFCSQCDESEFAVVSLSEEEIKSMPEVSTQAILELLDRKGVESIPVLKYFTEDLLPVKSDKMISLRKLKELFET